MLRPHALDEIIGDRRDAESIATAIAQSSLLRNAIERGIANGKENEAEAKKQSGWVGPSFAQSVREEIQNALSDSAH